MWDWALLLSQADISAYIGQPRSAKAESATSGQLSRSSSSPVLPIASKQSYRNQYTFSPNWISVPINNVFLKHEHLSPQLRRPYSPPSPCTRGLKGTCKTQLDCQGRQGEYACTVLYILPFIASVYEYTGRAWQCGQQRRCSAITLGQCCIEVIIWDLPTFFCNKDAVNHWHMNAKSTVSAM